jgi:hypothetical protein
MIRWYAILNITQYADVPDATTCIHPPFLKSRLLGYISQSGLAGMAFHAISNARAGILQYQLIAKSMLT